MRRWKLSSVFDLASNDAPSFGCLSLCTTGLKWKRTTFVRRVGFVLHSFIATNSRLPSLSSIYFLNSSAASILVPQSPTLWAPHPLPPFPPKESWRFPSASGLYFWQQIATKMSSVDRSWNICWDKLTSLHLHTNTFLLSFFFNFFSLGLEGLYLPNDAGWATYILMMKKTTLSRK